MTTPKTGTRRWFPAQQRQANYLILSFPAVLHRHPSATLAEFYTNLFFQRRSTLDLLPGDFLVRPPAETPEEFTASLAEAGPKLAFILEGGL